MSFLLAAAFTGASSRVPSMFSDAAAPRHDAAAISSVEEPVTRSGGAGVPPATGPALLEVVPPTAVVPDLPTPVEAVGRSDPRDDSTGARPSPSPSWVLPPNSDRALISWWNEERWKERDAEAEEWRREWLRFARARPEQVPLELWLSLLEWAPQDRDLLRSAERATDRYASRRRRGGWMASGSDDRRVASSEAAQVAAQIERAVRDAQRRAEFGEQRSGGPESSWYRSLLRRLRGGGA